MLDLKSEYSIITPIDQKENDIYVISCQLKEKRDIINCELEEIAKLQRDSKLLQEEITTKEIVCREADSTKLEYQVGLNDAEIRK